MIRKSTLILFGFMLSFTNIGSLNESQIDDEIKKIQKTSPSNPREIIVLATDIYRIAKKRNYKKGMLNINSLLITNYFNQRDFKKVIQLSEETEKLALEGKNDTALANIYRFRAAAYIELNYNNKGLEELKKSIDIAEKIGSINDRNYLKSLTYREFAVYYSHINAPVDSVLYYHNKCLESALNIQSEKEFIRKKNSMLAISYMNIGMMNVALDHIEDALLNLSKALKICQTEKNYIHGDLEVSILNELAWIYYEQKKYSDATRYAEKAEKAEKKARLPYIRRDIYEVSFKSYLALKLDERSKTYTNLYIKLNDSLVNVEKNELNLNIKKIGKDKEQTDIEFRFNTLQIILIIITLIVVIFFLFLKLPYLINNVFAKKSINVLKPNELVSDELSINESPENFIKKNIAIPEHTSKSILVKLDRFEKSQKFIRKDVSLSSLANDLNTNTRYLSETIKQYKKKNYNNYINGLRINYIKDKLIEDPIYREYKISYLAEECGFSSREVFAVTFKKETGVTPSFFINNLDNNLN